MKGKVVIHINTNNFVTKKYKNFSTQNILSPYDTKTEASTSKKEVKIATTDQEHEARVQSQNTCVQSVGKPKRVITRPFYLNDYI